MDKDPRITNSAGHGLSSRVSGQVDPGAEVVNTPGTEADAVLRFTLDMDANYRVLFAGRKHSAHVVANTGRYYLADNKAVQYHCDTFNEFHTDAAKKSRTKDGKKYGVSVLYEDPKDAGYAKRLSAAIAEASGLPDRGAKYRTNLAVLTPHSGMRQVIIELFFGTDADDVAAFKAHRDAVEVAILNVNLREWGWRTIKMPIPPRKWGRVKRLFYRARRFHPNLGR